MELKLCNLGLSQIPSDVWTHTDLRKLDLSGNQLTSLPYQLGYLTKIQTLNVSNNRLTSLSYQLGYLTDLQVLNVSNNQLTSLPYQIGYLTMLRKLDVRGNQLTSLPYQISHLPELQELDVSKNRLTSLPYQLKHLTNLRRLVVNDNRLDSLPSGFVHLLSPSRSDFSANNRQSRLAQRAEQTHPNADVEQAELLLQSEQERAAGTIAGVALEAYLKNLCDQHYISYSERGGLQSLIQNLEEEQAITSQEASHMMRLSSIRNKCAHSSPVTKQEVSLLVREVRKLLN